MDEVSLVEYQIEYPTLNLKVKKENEMLFDYGMLYCYTKECRNGYKVKKITKTTNKGTKFTYMMIKDREDAEKYKEFLDSMVKDFNERHGQSLTAVSEY